MNERMTRKNGMEIFEQSVIPLESIMRNYDIIDSVTESSYDNLCAMAAYITDCPIAMITFKDRHRLWCKAITGSSVREGPYDASICRLVFDAKKPVIYDDTTLSQEVKDLPYVAGPPYFRSYAGFPVKTPDDIVLGTLCVIDFKSKHLDDKQKAMLNSLTLQILQLLELRRYTAKIQIHNALEKELLITNEKVARQSNESKSVFLRNMSHEIRTPIASIIGVSEILNDSPLQPEQKDYLSAIRHQAEGLLVIVNDILDFSKMEAGKLELEESHWNIRETLQTMHKSLDVLASNKNLTLTTTVEDSVPDGNIISDHGRYRQVVTNLVSNAIKFTDKGTVNVHVRMDPTKSTVITKVVDTGIGISPNFQRELFVPFVQAATARKFGGTGLGLSICKLLTEAWKGEIYCSSNLDPKKGPVGSCFEFTMPIKHSLPCKKRLEHHPISKLEWKSAPNVLVAEDNETLRTIVRQQLHKCGVNTIIVENGQDALRVFENEEAVDLVFMDCQMPVMDGFEATRHIRDINAHIPIIALTANAMKEDQEDCIKAGMTDFISKPLRLPDLKNLLIKYLEHYLTETNSPP